MLSRGLCVGLSLIALPALAAERYAAQLQDGTRVEEAEIKTWHDVAAAPTIGGKPIFDAGNPARWIIDRHQPPGPTAPAYVEFVGGDRLAGTVVGVQTGLEDPYDQRPPHLFVKPAADLHYADDKLPGDLRVALAWVRRIVWEHAGGEEYRPGTVVLRDGGTFPFRTLRWEGDQLRFLTSDGVRDVEWDKLAELHLPQPDVWEAYFDQLATINPTCLSRMIALETVNGSRFTTSAERFRAKTTGDANRPDTWFQHIQPVWSLDPLWVRYRSVRAWRFFQPDSVPLTHVGPAAVEQRSVFGSSWLWRSDRSSRGELLQSAKFEFGGGFGVQASTELRFDYPPMARAIRTQVGLDRSAENGGCVNLAVRGGISQPLFEAKHVIGSERVIDTGWLALPSDEAAPRQLILEADMDHDQRPPGAEPFDIRDAVNWYEPELRLDLPLLQAEVLKRGWTRIPALAGWTMSAEDAATIRIANVVYPYDPRRAEFRLKFLTTDRFVTFSRTMKIGPQHRWLAAVLTRDHEQTTPMSVQFRIDGKVLGDLDVPMQQGPLEPDPLIVPLDGYQGKTVLVEIAVLPQGEKSLIDWKGVSLSESKPGVMPIFEDAESFAAVLKQGDKPSVALSLDQPYSGTHALRVAGGSAENGHLPGLDTWIAEQPRNGQYRFLVFAWRKAGGQRILMQLAHEGKFSEHIAQLFAPGERPTRRRLGPFDPKRQLEDRGLKYGFAYDAGNEPPLANAPLRLAAAIPDKWVASSRDLFVDFGPIHLTGVSLGSPDGEAAFFDHIYLARTPADVEYLRTFLVNPQQPPAKDPEATVALRMAKRDDYSRLLSRIAPQFSTELVPGGLALMQEHAGQLDALRTQPIDANKPCVLRATLYLPAEKSQYLDLRVSHVPMHDWKLIVKVNGEVVHEQLIDDALTIPQRGWASVQVGLEKFAGKKVLLEVLNQANDARNETAYWKRVAIEER